MLHCVAYHVQSVIVDTVWSTSSAESFTDQHCSAIAVNIDINAGSIIE